MELVISDRETKFKDPLIIKAFIEAIEKPEDVTHLFLDFSNINLKLATFLSLKIKEMINLKHITLKLYSELLEKIFIKTFENINGSLIESVDFDFYFVYSDAPESLCKFLSQAKNLEYFKISNLNNRGTWIIPLLQKLINSKCKIKYLNIDYKKFNLITEERPGLLISQLPSLGILNINRCGLFGDKLSVFLKDIKDLKLKQLYLYGNIISLESCSLLGNMFGKNEMKRLDMGNCQIRDNALIAFLDGWEQGINTKNHEDDYQKSLEELALTQLNTKKMNELFKLHRRFSFEEKKKEEQMYKQILDLSYNHITQSGINFLANFMKDKMNIKITFSKYKTYDTSMLVNVVEKNLGFVSPK
ncbi:hypothetical protein CDIK_2362 [Cucumispora dikerogammari]|nr:hypothetical protein CDIK_2362 [Cucumispora dikerogammari]